ncbi:protein Skeletor: isoforms D/E-like protein, partial [Leptotrombidium deliense]
MNSLHLENVIEKTFTTLTYPRFILHYFLLCESFSYFNSLQSQMNANGQQPPKPYFGTPLGKLKTNAHGVTGDVFIVDESTIFIKNFNYDGLGPDAYFWSGYTPKPEQNGFIIPDEKGSTKPLSAYKNKNVVLRLPEGNTVRDIKWIAVWCRKAVVNFGDVSIPKNV